MPASRAPLARSPLAHRWIIGVFGASWLVNFWPLLSGQVLIWGLPALQFLPWYTLSRAAWLAGEVPLWNPYNGAGEPLLANYQSGVLYLFNLAYTLLPHPATIGWVAVAHLALAAGGMWLWAATLPETTRLSRAVAALAYGTGSVILQRLDNFAMLAAAAWAPWVWWAIANALDKPGLRRYVIQALVVAALLLAGHAQWGFYVLLLGGVCALARVWMVTRLPWPRLLGVLAAVLLGMLLAGVQLAPTFELLRDSARAGGLDYDYVVNFSFHPIALFLFVAPFFFGHPGEGSYILNGALFEIAPYVGLLPVLLLPGMLRQLWRAWREQRSLNEAQRWMVFFSGVALLALLIAMGQFGPLFPALFRWVPTFGMFQAPSRWLLVVTLALCSLVALALPRWQPSVFWTRLSLAGALAIAFGGVGGLALAGPGTERTISGALLTLGLAWAAASALGLVQPAADSPWRARWALAVLVFVGADLAWSAHALRPTVSADFYAPRATQPGRSYWPGELLRDVQFDQYLLLDDYPAVVAQRDAFRNSELPNLNAIDQTPSFNSFNPLRPGQLQRYAELLDSYGNPALFSAAAITRTPAGAPIDTVPPGTPTLGRAWVVPQAIHVADDAGAEAALLAPGWEPAQTVILQGDWLPVQGSESLAAVVTISAETPTRLQLEVQSDGPGWLVLADTYYPGWQAELNGEPLPIYRANLAFRALEIPAGDSTVSFHYAPRSWRIGLGMTALGLLCVLGMLGYTRLNGKR